MAVLMKSKHKGVFVAVAVVVLRIHRCRLFYARLTFSFSLLHLYLSMILPLAHFTSRPAIRLKGLGNVDSALFTLPLCMILSEWLRELALAVRGSKEAGFKQPLGKEYGLLQSDCIHC